MEKRVHEERQKNGKDLREMMTSLLRLEAKDWKNVRVVETRKIKFCFGGILDVLTLFYRTGLICIHG